jgi:hypothetical protein
MRPAETAAVIEEFLADEHASPGSKTSLFSRTVSHSQHRG